MAQMSTKASFILGLLEMIHLNQETAIEYAEAFEQAAQNECETSECFLRIPDPAAITPDANLITADMFYAIARWLRHPENHVPRKS